MTATVPGLLAVALGAALCPGAVLAQATPFVSALVQKSAEIRPLRMVDPSTAAARRYAIVIGNSDYEAIPDLPNTLADASAVAHLLEQEGYLVYHFENVTKRGFEDILRRVLFDVDPDTQVVVFFAGHGFQVGPENYLVPVDADLDSVYDLPFEAVSLGSLVNIVGTRARLQIVILDSCRDNPFAGRAAMAQMGNDLREIRTGFSSQAAPLNSMLIFSTAPGSVAYDGGGTNSPFTESFVQVVSERPGALVNEVVEGVRRLVYDRTGGRQVPWDSSTLVEPATFGPVGAGGEAQPPQPSSEEAGGPTRGMALVTTGDGTKPSDAAARSAVSISADFVPEVAIGPAIRDALALSPGTEVTILRAPRIGHVVLEEEGGARRDAEGATLSGDEIGRILLVNRSVQIPAASLPDGVIHDALTVAVGGQETDVAIDLRPDPCDFEAGDHLDPNGMGITRYPNEIRPEIARAACQASVERAPEVGRFHFQLGRALVALRRYDEANTEFARARDLGHVRAWNALGSALLNEERRTGGLASPVGSDEVLALFARGVQEGDPYAYYSLGYQLLNFGETEDVQIEGYDLMMRALELGHTFAMNAMSEFYLDEGSAHYNAERGLRYLRESADRGDIYGYNNLGLAYLQGRGGLAVDKAAAFDLFMKAAEGGHPTAPFNLAGMYRDGDVGGRPDLRQAVDWFARGLERGDALAGAHAAYLIMTEDVPGYDRFDAAVLAAKGAALGNLSDAEEARAQLVAMPGNVLDGGAQKLLRELGGDIEPDGDFGPASEEIMARLLDQYGAGPAQSDPVERIVQLAGLVWIRSPFRVDLY
ncbi:caspase family protein [Rubellimicrobium arenae]|uniref:caspase family protein n=1 Tax=Rubellimicrobium arenae TaxID=2817372 RepID=UPI001B311736|nr:caspase family protein [Rubellimicrobium arenae]